MSIDVHDVLAVERDETAARIAVLVHDLGTLTQASEQVATDDEHDPDGSGGIAVSRAQLQALLEQANSHLADVDAAIERVRAGTYGVCERCGREIAPARLEARPTARLCIECASRR
jgi:RNA polymerase-binding protein DksA